MIRTITTATSPRLEEMRTSLEYGQKLRQNCEFFTHFQKFLEEKDQNIHLNDKFPLKIANTSLQKLNFRIMRFPNSAFFPCMTFPHVDRICNTLNIITICAMHPTPSDCFEMEDGKIFDMMWGKVDIMHDEKYLFSHYI